MTAIALSSAPTKARLNLKSEVVQVLRIVQESEEAHAASYLIRLLRGDQRFGLKHATHAYLQDFGSMSDVHSEHIQGLIRLMLKRELLTVAHKRYGTLALTPDGQAFLAQPDDLIVAASALRHTPLDQQLLEALRSLRRTLSANDAKAPFRIFTDHSLECLVAQKPTEATALYAIPGFGDFKVNRYGPAVLQTIQQVVKQEDTHQLKKWEARVAGPTYQVTRALYETGLSEMEIAAKRQLSPATIRKHLISLHRAQQIDLIPWIEHKVPADTLESGVALLQKHATSTQLRQAYETLGLDYETLKLCRLYVSKVSNQQDQLPKAS